MFVGLGTETPALMLRGAGILCPGIMRSRSESRRDDCRYLRWAVPWLTFLLSGRCGYFLMKF